MKAKKTPLRTCVACGRSAAKHELVRIVRSPDGETRVDPGGKANGRGAYVCADPACFEAAVRKRRLTAALRVSLGEEDVERIREQFEETVRTAPDATSRSGR
jgi:hypothetical protein